MDYRGKILQMDLQGAGHARTYICTGHCNGQIEFVSAAPGAEAVEYAPVPLDDVCIRSYWSEPGLIDTVKQRIRGEVRRMLAGKESCPTFNSVKFEAMHHNLSKLDSLDGDQPADLLPPVPEKCQDVSVRPNYVGKLLFIEFPLDSDAAYDSGLFIIVAQSDDSLYAVLAESAARGAVIGRIPFTAGDESIKILSVVEDDYFINEFIQRLDDMTTDDYPAEVCDAAETVSRVLTHLLPTVAAAAGPAASALDHLFHTAAADFVFNTLGCNSGRCAGCSCN